MADAAAPASLPVGNVSPHAPGRLGFWGLVATEGALFGALLFAYYYSAFRVGRPWPPEGLPHLSLSAPNTVLLLLSSVTLWLGERSIKRGGRGLLTFILLTLLLGTVFALIQLKEWSNKHFAINDHAYAAHFFTITGFHLAHVTFGLIMLAAASVWTARGYFDRRRHEPISMVSLYWHFVDVVWLCVFFTLYVTPYFLR